MNSFIEIKNLTKKFNETTALDNISFTVQEQEVVVFIGPSGAGKSTLLRCINHLEQPSAGEIFIDGDKLGKNSNLDKIRADMGMVFQSFNLFPHLTVLDNIILAPVKVRGLKKTRAIELARYLLSKIGLAEKETAYPEQLSGGQQQRAAIARALAMRPKLMLFDEPTFSLDPKMGKEVLDVMEELAREGMTMLVVTHEMGFARHVGKRVMFMDEGRILEQGSPSELFYHCREERTRSFLSKLL